MTDSLRSLERDGLVARRVFTEVPARVEYSLTPLGWTITEPLVALADWDEVHGPEVQTARARAKRQRVKPSRVAVELRRPERSIADADRPKGAAASALDRSCVGGLPAQRRSLIPLVGSLLPVTGALRSHARHVLGRAGVEDLVLRVRHLGA